MDEAGLRDADGGGCISTTRPDGIRRSPVEALCGDAGVVARTLNIELYHMIKGAASGDLLVGYSRVRSVPNSTLSRLHVDAPIPRRQPVDVEATAGEPRPGLRGPREPRTLQSE